MTAPVFVLGSFRGGTSCTAGTLAALGVSMGRGMRRGNHANPKGFFEAPALAQICRRAFREPSMVRRWDSPRIVAALDDWIRDRRRWDPAERIGAKHPTLCLMVPEICEAIPGALFVRVVRPVAESTASLARLGWWTRRARQRVPRLLTETRDRELAKLPADRVISFHFPALCRDPSAAVARLCDFLEITPNESQRTAALNFPMQRE